MSNAVLHEDYVMDNRPLWMQDIEFNAVGKKIYAICPYVQGTIVGIEEHKCDSCHKVHLMYKVMLQVGVPLEIYICPTAAIKIDNEFMWTRTVMTENDPDAAFFGIPEKVVSNYVDFSELDAIQEKIDFLRMVLYTEEDCSANTKKVLDNLRRKYINQKERLER